MKKLLSIVLILAVLAGLLPGCGDGVRTVLDAPSKIALVLRDQSGASGLALEAGAKRAGAELEIQVVNLSPEEQDSTLQAQQIRQAVAENCEAILVSYQNSAEVTQALEEAAAAGVALVYVDTAATDVDRVIYGTDHYAAGRQAAQTMLELLEIRRIRAGTLGIIGVNQRDAAALQREAGFRDALQGESFAITKTRYDAKNPVRARNITEDYINHSDVVGIFAVSDVSTLSAGYAAKALGADPIVVGFGQSQQLQTLLDEGHVRASLEEDYDAMGYGAVKAAAAILRGETVEQDLTDTGISVVKSDTPLLRPGDLRLALIVGDKRDEYWKNLVEGALAAAQELGCSVENLSPETPNAAGQVQQIHQAVEKGYYGIIAAAGSSDPVKAALREAEKAGLTVVCVDHTVSHREADAVIAPDHREVGRMAARAVLEELAERKKEKGEIGIIGVNQDDEAALLREEGFREVFAGTAYQLLDTKYAEQDAARSHSLATELLKDGADVIFGCSESGVIGAERAVKEANKKIVVAGYGRPGKVGKLKESGRVQVILVLQPEVIGANAVKTACALILEEELPDTTEEEMVILLKE